MMIMYRTTVRQREFSPIYGCTIHDHYGNTGYEVLILGILNYVPGLHMKFNAHLNFALEFVLILCGEVAFFIQFIFTKLRWVPENSIVGHENCDNKNIEDRADIC